MNRPKSLLALAGLVFSTPACAHPTETGAEPGVTIDWSSIPAPRIKKLRTKNPTDLLFVGNSYLYYGDSVHNHVRRMAVAAGLYQPSQLTYKSATIGGAAIFDHNLEHYLQPENLRVKKPFEVVILQGGSAAPLSEKRRKRFAETASDFAAMIGKSGGETVLYMTHAYVKPHARFRPGMIKDIASLYIETGNEIDALVIPVGLAFEEAYRRNPDIKLHKSFDGSHPELAGTYLAAATVFASLYETSPIGNDYDYFGTIDRKTVLFLQTVAHDTVTKFYGRN